MRDPALQKKIISYGIKKAPPIVENLGHELIDQLSTKVRPNEKYKTNRKDLDGSGIPFPFPFVDLKMWDVISNLNLFKGPDVSEKKAMEGFVKAVSNHKGYANVLKKHSKKFITEEMLTFIRSSENSPRRKKVGLCPVTIIQVHTTLSTNN